MVGTADFLRFAAPWEAQGKDEPLKNDWEAFQKDGTSQAPAEWLKVSEEGIDSFESIEGTSSRFWRSLLRCNPARPSLL